MRRVKIFSAEGRKMFYVPLEDARTGLVSRRYLRKEVEAWWRSEGMMFPEVLLDGSRLFGFNVRQLASCRYEDLVFIRMCEIGNLTPLWAPFERDLYVDNSPLKCSYLQPRIVKGFGKKSERSSLIIRKKRLTHPMQCQGLALNEIMIEGGRNLVSWHRSFLEAVYPGAIVSDFSYFYKALSRPRVYYPFLLSLFVAHGVLVEDYHGGESGTRLDAFTGNIFTPAFREVQARFGAYPLIVPLPWWKELAYYPSLERMTNGGAGWVFIQDRPILRDYSTFSWRWATAGVEVF